MNLSQAFSKIGVEVKRVSKQGRQTVILVKIPADDTGKVQTRWKAAIEEVVVRSHEESEKQKRWSADVSKWFFAMDGGVRFLWRIVLNGNFETSEPVIVNSILAGLRAGVEVTSMPLIGRSDHKMRDGKPTKTMGAYGMAEGASVAEAAISGGGRSA